MNRHRGAVVKRIKLVPRGSTVYVYVFIYTSSSLRFGRETRREKHKVGMKPHKKMTFYWIAIIIIIM